MAGDDDQRASTRAEQALDALSRLGMLGLLLAVPAAAVWAVRKLLRRGR